MVLTGFIMVMNAVVIFLVLLHAGVTFHIAFQATRLHRRREWIVTMIFTSAQVKIVGHGNDGDTYTTILVDDTSSDNSSIYWNSTDQRKINWKLW